MNALVKTVNLEVSKIMCYDYLNNVIFWRTNFCGIKRKITSKHLAKLTNMPFVYLRKKRKRKGPCPDAGKYAGFGKRLQPVISCITMVCL